MSLFSIIETQQQENLTPQQKIRVSVSELSHNCLSFTRFYLLAAEKLPHPHPPHFDSFCSKIVCSVFFVFFTLSLQKVNLTNETKRCDHSNESSR